MGIITSVAKNIEQEIFSFIDKELYNHRKDKEGLISLQNDQLNSLKNVITNWANEQKVKEQRIERMI